MTTRVEPVSAWEDHGGLNLLSLSYENPLRFMNQFQLLVMKSLTELLLAPSASKAVVVERDVQSSYHVFASAHYKLGHLSSPQLNNLRLLMEDTNRRLTQRYDQVVRVVLEVPKDVAALRRESRGRASEDKMTGDLERILFDQYRAWTESLRRTETCIFLDASQPVSDVLDQLLLELATGDQRAGGEGLARRAST